ncbi:MAG: TetR family transcriptional regulator [Hyphomicrobiaceae bacterium]|nr:MAG: TetR family transcriptional regulator [Hyphomicrobiaceae bacterium]
MSAANVATGLPSGQQPKELTLLACSDARVAGRWSSEPNDADNQLARMLYFADLLVEAGVTKNLGDRNAARTIEASITHLNGGGRVSDAESRRIHRDHSTLVWETTLTSGDGTIVGIVRHVQIIGASKAAAEAGTKTTAQKVLSADRGDRREALVRAAIRAFSEKGFIRASVKDVATAAGMTTPTMYHYIKTKEDLLTLVFSAILERIYETLTSSTGGDAPAADRLMAGVNALLNMYRSDPAMIMLLYEEGRHLRPDDRRKSFRQSAEGIEIWRALLQEGNESGAFDVPDPEVWAELVSLLCTVGPLRYWNVKKFGQARVEKAVAQFVASAVLRREDDLPSKKRHDGPRTVKRP